MVGRSLAGLALRVEVGCILAGAMARDSQLVGERRTQREVVAMAHDSQLVGERHIPWGVEVNARYTQLVGVRLVGGHHIQPGAEVRAHGIRMAGLRRIQRGVGVRARRDNRLVVGEAGHNGLVEVGNGPVEGLEEHRMAAGGMEAAGGLEEVVRMRRMAPLCHDMYVSIKEMRGKREYVFWGKRSKGTHGLVGGIGRTL